MTKLPFDLLQQGIDYAVLNSDFQGAFECYNSVKKWLTNKSGLAKNSPEYLQYENYLMKLKFLSFNYLSDNNERVDLIRDNFNLAFEIENFNIWDKINTELISIGDIKERDAFKVEMKEAMEKCENIFISRQKYENQEIPRKVSEWIKSFIANLGLDKFDKVKKIEYLSNNRAIKILDSSDKEKVKALLDIYEKLRISSKTPEGYENSVLMNIDGKSVIFNQGSIEDVSNIDKIKNVQKLDDIVNNGEKSTVSNNVFEKGGVKSGLGNIKDDLALENKNKASTENSTEFTSELEQSLKNYSPSSLEYKALSQEILRLKRTEAKRELNK
jgi:hypothetical protein